MSQQLHLFPETSTALNDTASDALVEQTKQLFQHNGSNAELMLQIMSAIKALDEICEQPKE